MVLTDEILIMLAGPINMVKGHVGVRVSPFFDDVEKDDAPIFAAILTSLNPELIGAFLPGVIAPDTVFKLALRAIEKKPRIFSKIVNKLHPTMRYILAVHAVEHGLDRIVGLDMTRTKYVDLALKIVSKHGRQLSKVPSEMLSSDKYEKFIEAAKQNDPVTFRGMDCRHEYMRYLLDCDEYGRAVVHQDLSRDELCQMIIDAYKFKPKLMRDLNRIRLSVKEMRRVVRELVKHDGNNLIYVPSDHKMFIDTGTIDAILDPSFVSAYDEVVILALQNGLTNLTAIDFTLFDPNAHKESIIKVLRQHGGSLSWIKGIRDYYDFALAASYHSNDIDWSRLSKEQAMVVRKNILARDPNGLRFRCTYHERKELLRHATIGAVPAGYFTREEYDELAKKWAKRGKIDLSQLDHEQCSPSVYVAIAKQAVEQDPKALWEMHVPIIGAKAYGEMAKKAFERDHIAVCHVQYPPCPTKVYRQMLEQLL